MNSPGRDRVVSAVTFPLRHAAPRGHPAVAEPDRGHHGSRRRSQEVTVG